MRNKFKNMRRPDRAWKMCVNKKLKTDDASDSASAATLCTTVSNIEQYERYVQQLQKLYCSGKWSTPRLTSLLHESSKLWRDWIRQERPPVKDVLVKFPCLQEPRLVSLYTVHVHEEVIVAAFKLTQGWFFFYNVYECWHLLLRVL